MSTVFNWLKAAFNQFEEGVKLIGLLAVCGGLVFAVGAFVGAIIGMAFGQPNIFAIVGGTIYLCYNARTIVRIVAPLFAEGEE